MAKTWTYEKLRLPLRFDWKISRNTSSEKLNFIVRVNEGLLTSMGEVAFNVRYGESESSIETGLKHFLQIANSVVKIDDLHPAMERLELDQSLRFAIESAWVGLEALKHGKSVAQFLDLREVAEIKTSFSLPILEVGEIAEFIHSQNLARFSFLKIKVNENAMASVREVAKHFKGPLRVDPNEAWRDPDQVLQFIEQVSDLSVEFIEQPLPSDMSDALLYLKRESVKLKKCPDLIADESITSEGVSEYHRERFHGVNVKLMKAGGYIPALNQLRKAREMGMKTMLGCMVETSVGIRAAMELADGVDYFDLDGFLLLKQDSFGLVSEEGGVLSKQLSK